MKVLVTGATGFIGNYVVEELLKWNCEIIATSTSTEKAATYSWFENVDYMNFSLDGSFEQRNLYQFFKEPDVAIHLAWQGLPYYKEL